MPSFSKLASMAKSASGDGSDTKFTRMIIKGYKDVQRQKSHDEYELFLNPNKITHSHKVVFSKDEALGSTVPENKYTQTGPQTFEFEFMLDGTGATGIPCVVADHIKKFKAVTFDYIGEEHETPYVTIEYSNDLKFHGRLSDLNITYEMFKPSGEPLRAKVRATFTTAEDRKKDAAASGRSSPDLSHLVTVKEGDNLPMMCEKVYGDSSKYLDVARVNNLVNFRNLKPGTELLFPPIR